LRQVRQGLREKKRGRNASEAIALALNAVRTLEIPHLESEEDEGQIVH
jgi:hypothetical protein